MKVIPLLLVVQSLEAQLIPVNVNYPTASSEAYASAITAYYDMYLPDTTTRAFPNKYGPAMCAPGTFITELEWEWYSSSSWVFRVHITCLDPWGNNINYNTISASFGDNHCNAVDDSSCRITTPGWKVPNGALTELYFKPKTIFTNGNPGDYWWSVDTISVTRCNAGQYITGLFGSGNSNGNLETLYGYCGPVYKQCAVLSPGLYKISDCTYYKDTGLPVCLAGSYCPGDGSITQCKAGYSSGAGASVCSICPAGVFCGQGASSWQACTSGYTCPAGSGSATPCNCPTGNYWKSGCQANDWGAVVCAPCAALFYKTTTNVEACLACTKSNPGQVLTSSATTTGNTKDCTYGPVSAGYYSAGGDYTTSGTICGAGKFSISGATACSSCTGSTFSAPGQASCTQCTSCLPGNVQTTACSVTSDTVCTQCITKGNSCPGGTITSDTCAQCTAGKYLLYGCGWMGTADTTWGLANCALCTAGSFCLGGSNLQISNVAIPTPCLAGTYSTGGTTACTACTFGKYSAATGMTSDCPTLCPAGYYSSGIGMTAFSACSTCNAGTYNPNQAQSACKNCANGTYSPQGVNTDCYMCNPGTYGTSPGQASLSAGCAGSCNAGTYSTASGAQSSATCIGCVAGKFSATTGASASAACTNCVAGTYTTIAGKSACDPCPAGTFSTAVGANSFSCGKCPTGNVTTSAGMTSCTACAGGSYANGSASVCIMCSPGSYSLGSPATNCTSCSKGTYQSSLGQTFCNTCSNKICVAGQILIACTEKTDNDCVTCKVTSDPKTWVPLDASFQYIDLNCNWTCKPDYYLSTSAALPNTKPACSSCDTEYSCNVGQYPGNCGGTSPTNCQPCVSKVANMFFIGSGSYGLEGSCDYYCNTGYISTNSDINAILHPPSCTACNVGQETINVDSSSSSSATTCLDCNPGYYANTTGTICTFCGYGTYSSGYRSSACTACSPGSYGNSNYLTECTPCGTGKYSNAGAKSCTNCGIGTYQTGSGASSCILCSPGKYQKTTSSLVCSNCLSPTYATQSGATVCDACQPCNGIGYYNSLCGGASNGTCQPCS